MGYVDKAGVSDWNIKRDRYEENLAKQGMQSVFHNET